MGDVTKLDDFRPWQEVARIRYNAETAKAIVFHALKYFPDTDEGQVLAALHLISAAMSLCGKREGLHLIVDHIYDEIEGAP